MLLACLEYWKKNNESESENSLAAPQIEHATYIPHQDPHGITRPLTRCDSMRASCFQCGFQIVTNSASNTMVDTWTNTGLKDAATTGSYAWTDFASTPTGSSGTFAGLMMHPGLHRLYVRSCFKECCGSGMPYVLQLPYSSTCIHQRSQRGQQTKPPSLRSVDIIYVVMRTTAHYVHVSNRSGYRRHELGCLCDPSRV